MRITLSIALGGCLALALAGAGRAGEEISYDPPTPLEGHVADAPVSDGTHCLPRCWAEFDYLLVWAKANPVPALATTGPVEVLGPDGFPGTLGAPGTAVVLGGQNVDSNPASGFRIVVGGWLNDGCCYGAEASYFRVFERSEQGGVSGSGLPGTSALSVPFFNALSQQESSVGIAFPREISPIAGSAQLDVSTQIQGAEVNALCRVYEKPRSRLDVIFGYRWIQLDEDLSFSTQSTVVDAGSVFRTLDTFRCSNDFHGLQLGLREQVYFGRLFFRATGKIAAGNMHQLTRTDGSLVTDNFPGLAGTPTRFAGGYLAQPSNTGRFATDRFAWVPEATVGAGLHVRDWLRLSVSYTMLYLTTVTRPGDQIDRVINPTQGPAFTGDPTLGVAGPSRPSYQGRSNEYWLQGVSFGAEVRF